MSDNSINNTNHPIDVVIAWVDGSDPRLKEKRERYTNGENTFNVHGAHTTRFASNNEIRYCILSILKFAPFVRNIYIVTDDQDPNYSEYIKRYFPDRLSSIRIVDHKEIFRGFEEHLPSFNSISIGNMIWRINGLSENFAYFNDDVFLIREVKPTDWVLNNRPVLRGEWRFPPYIKILKNYFKLIFNRYILDNTNYREKFSFFLVQWNAARTLGMRFRYFVNGHTPHIMNRTRLENFFTKSTTLLQRNISFRFRDQNQFNVSTLSNHLEILSGNKQIQMFRLGYLNPAYHTIKRFKRKVLRCETDLRIKSVCVQSLDMAGPSEQESLYRWLDRFLVLD